MPLATMKTKQIITLLIASYAMALTSGCAKNYCAKFYQSTNPNEAQLESYSKNTRIVRTLDIVNDHKGFIKQGYVTIGRSTFWQDGNIPEKYLIAQGKKVGADVVLFQEDHTGSYLQSGTTYDYMPEQTINTQGTATVTGLGAYGNRTANVDYSSQSTAPAKMQARTTINTVHRFTCDTVFMRKGKAPIHGLVLAELTSAQKREIESNNGASVLFTVNSSPAYDADIIDGDVILDINDNKVKSAKFASSLLSELAGSEVTIKVWRGGKVISRKVKLNESYAKSALPSEA